TEPYLIRPHRPFWRDVVSHHIRYPALAAGVVWPVTTKHLRVAAVIAIAVLLQFSAGGLATAASPGKSAEIGTKFPDRFPVIQNLYLGKPVIGFGSDVGRVEHVPVIFLHGNNDTPFPTACNPLGRMQAFAQFLVDHGYRPSELWGLGY